MQSERPDGAAHAGDLHGRSLLAVFAHPDDESLACGALLAWCAQLGVRVTLLCLTDGRHGQRTLPQADAATFGSRRTRELYAAGHVLGVSDVFVLPYEDGMLSWQEDGQPGRDILFVIQKVHPDVVLTFDEDGLYWHPDHLAVHEGTTAAVAAAEGFSPALYYVTLPVGGMRAVVQHAREARARQGLSPDAPLRILGIADPDAFGAAAPAPTLVVDVAAFAGRKLAAIRCHGSQLVDDAFEFVEEEAAARLLGVEQYRRAGVGFQGETFIDRLAAASVS